MNIKQQEEKGRFVQFPLYLIYGCPELTRDDRFVLLAIMGEYWTSGPHKLSYRDIASLSGVPISLLSSIKGKDGKPDKEGIIDRLVRLGFIKVTLGKELKAGRATGNAQTFVEIEYKKIWQDNVLYCEDRKHPDNKEVEFQPVSYTNRLKKAQPVRIENEPVSYTNRLDPYTNEPVSYTNNPVRDTSSKVTPNITDINTNKDKEDSVAFLSDDKERTPSSLVSHPNHDFIWFDDLMAPSRMVIKLTPPFPHPYYSEQEDKRRERIACLEVKPYLEQRGLRIAIQWEHEIEKETIEAIQGSPTRTNDAKSPIVSETTTENDIAALATGKDRQELTDAKSMEEQQQDSSQETLWNNENPVSTVEQTKKNNTGKRQSRKKPDLTNEPIVMPEDDAPWDKETIVQIHEAHQGRRYPNGAKKKSARIRDNELEAAQVIVDMKDLWTDNTAENRRRLLKIIEHLETRQNQWWINTNGHVMPHQLVDKDRIHQMVDELKRLKDPQKQNMQKISSGVKSPSSASAYTLEEIKALRRMTIEERKVFLEKRREEQEINATANGLATATQYA